MYRQCLALCAMLVLLSCAALAQNGALGYPDSFQVNYVPNLQGSDAVINLVNGGSHVPAGNLFIGTGYLCANIYVFGGDIGSAIDPQGEQLQACCTCAITRNGSASVRASQLTQNLATRAVLGSTTIKIVWTGPVGGPNSGVCDARRLPGDVDPLYGRPPAPANYGGFATGGRAWATKWHAAIPASNGRPGTPAFGTETEFSNVPLSPQERDILASNCAFIWGNLSGFGRCPGCPQGGTQGAVRR